MGKGKKKKHSKKSDEASEKPQKVSDTRSSEKSGQKRARSMPAKKKLDLPHDDQTNSPRNKSRKIVEVTVHNTETKEGDPQPARSVTVKNKAGNPAISDQSTDGIQPMDEGLEQPAEKVVQGVKTRSKGDLTQEEMEATLPEGKKKKCNTVNQKIEKQAKENADFENDPNALNSNPNNSVLTGDGVQMSVRADDNSSESELEAFDYESSVDTSEDSSSESSSSESTTDNEVRGAKKGKSKNSHKQVRRGTSTSSSDESSDEDQYHHRLLKQNPGLKSYLEKRKARQQKAKENRRRKRSKKAKKKSKSKVKNSASFNTVYSKLLNKIPRQSPEVTPTGKSNRDREAIARGLERLKLANKLASPVAESSKSDSDNSTSESDADQQQLREKAIHDAAEQLILNSEKFKATATTLPEGNDPYDYNKDGDFMMSTCHVEPTLVEKAEKGQYVELEKLRNKSLKELMNKESGKFKLDFLVKEGQSYVVAAQNDKEVKINSYRRWEQAFKVYMILFSEKNPTRAAEILAYADIISNASQTFVWENVAMYDYYFRRLMEKHPNRSWARTHTQLWTLTMKDHVNAKYLGFQLGNNNAGTSSGKKTLKELCCWRYNRGKCTRGDDCKFEHRCSLCGSPSHIMINCHRRHKKGEHKGDKTKTKTKSEVDVKTNDEN